MSNSSNQFLIRSHFLLVPFLIAITSAILECIELDTILSSIVDIDRRFSQKNPW